MVDEENEDQICKVVLLGESGVGKTSIISRFISLINYVIYFYTNLSLKKK